MTWGYVMPNADSVEIDRLLCVCVCVCVCLSHIQAVYVVL